MSLLVDRVTKLKPSPTLSLSSKAKAMKAAGEDVINLSVGEPDFDTPDYAKAGGIKAIEDGHTKYTAVDGMPDLKASIIEKFKRDNNLEYTPEQIVVGTGAKPLLFNAFQASVDKGDEVIIPSPYWVSYPSMVEVAGGTPVIVETTEKDGFKLTAEKLKAAITQKTKWLVLNSPSNPTGAVYSQGELEAIAGVIKAHNHVYVISDDIYEYLNYTGQSYKTIAEIEPTLIHRVLTVNGVSKAYAMTGWRIGFAGGPKELMRAMSKLQSQSTSNPASISQHAALAAMNGPKEDIERMRGIFEQRRDSFINNINAIEGLSVRVPDGAFYAYINCSGAIGKTTASGKTIETDLDFADYILEDFKVAIVPGTAFGCSPYVRASYALDIETLGEAASRLKKAMQSLG